ncbi:MAG: response regulator, partial [Thermoanaerobaculia bacterium]|nr:response regulator [Thermoanaerobaculia bacterium]
VYSEPGEGTTFKIYLPEADPEDEGRAVEGPDAAEGTGPPRPRRPRVLVAEDDEALRRLASVSIERLGCEVVTAVDGGAALEVFEASGPFDLVVTDVLMPEMSGHDLLAAIRKRSSDVKIILVSGHPSQLSDPGARILEKPFTPSRLSQAVRETLEPDLTGSDSDLQELERV